MTAQDMKRREEVVRSYFRLLSKIMEGDEKAVDEMLELWDEDGSFEYAGPPPMVGEFRCRIALKALFRNLTKTVGMPVSFETAPAAATNLSKTTIDLKEVIAADGKIVAHYETTLATKDGRGFIVVGSNTFTFKDSKILHLRSIRSPKPEEAVGLQLGELSVTDVGRLALACWAVV